MIKVVDGTVAHFSQAFDDIRREDMAEWYAGTGELFHLGAIRAVQTSEISKVALDEAGFPLCLWGGTGGRIWLFATSAGTRRALALHRILRPELDALQQRWPLLFATADGRNTTHHDWMRWLGFSELPAIRLPPFNLHFITFYRERF